MEIILDLPFGFPINNIISLYEAPGIDLISKLIAHFQSTHDFIKIKQGFALFEKSRILSGIQFPKHFMEIAVAATHRLFGVKSKVIGMHQACGQFLECHDDCVKQICSSSSFPLQTCYIILILKFGRAWILGLRDGAFFWLLSNRILLGSSTCFISTCHALEDTKGKVKH